MEQNIVKDINVKSLVFDPLNPRIPKELRINNNEENILDYMIKFGNIIDLLESIAETGYSNAEPLLVVKDEHGNYIVVEGNRRLAAVKLFNNPSLAKTREQAIFDIVNNAKVKPPTLIPCLIYKERDGILDYLGYRHITGVKEWGSLEKARYLDELYIKHSKKNISEDEVYKKLANMTGSKPYYVKNLHMALKLYEVADNEAWYGLNIERSDINFSWITTCLGYKGITEYIEYDSGHISTDNINKENYKNLIMWMFDKDNSIIKESRNLTQLSTALEVDEAVERLLKGASLADALLFTSEPEDAFMKLLNKSKTNLEQAKEAIEKLSSFPEHARDLIEDISKLNNSILGALKENFDNEVKNQFSNLTQEQLNSIKEIIESQNDGNR